MVHIIQLVFSDEKNQVILIHFSKKKIEALPFHSYVAKRNQLVWLLFFKEKFDNNNYNYNYQVRKIKYICVKFTCLELLWVQHQNMVSNNQYVSKYSKPVVLFVCQW